MSKKSSLQKETTNTLNKLKKELEVATHNTNMMKEVTGEQNKDLELARQEAEKIKKGMQKPSETNSRKKKMQSVRSLKT